VTKEEVQKLIGQNIKTQRKKRGMTAIELASLCDMEKSNMSRLEAGNTNPTVMTLYKISVVLGVKVQDLTKGL
jgi:transcriptional regulator with XRE-family HTH domain